MKKYILTEEDLSSMQLLFIDNFKELVMCKNCKHYKWSDNRAFGYPVKRCEYTGFEDIDDTDYCSRAERKKE